MKCGSYRTDTGNMQAVILKETKQLQNKFPNFILSLSDQEILQNTSDFYKSLILIYYYIYLYMYYINKLDELDVYAGQSLPTSFMVERRTDVLPIFAQDT